MKKIRLIASAAAVSVMTAALSLIVSGDELFHDSAADPLVSLSYINEVVIPEYDKKLAAYDEKLGEYSEIIDELTKKLDEITTANGVLSGEKDALLKRVETLEKRLTTDTGGSFDVVRLVNGQKLIADSTCEIILRSGSAIAVSIVANGLNDVTDGTDLVNAAPVELYHSILVPRGGDGRGIQVTSVEAYVMVRGGYHVVD